MQGRIFEKRPGRTLVNIRADSGADFGQNQQEPYGTRVDDDTPRQGLFVPYRFAQDIDNQRYQDQDRELGQQGRDGQQQYVIDSVQCPDYCRVTVFVRFDVDINPRIFGFGGDRCVSGFYREKSFVALGVLQPGRQKVGVLRDTVFFLHPNVFGRSLPTCRQTRRHVGHEAVDESCGQSQEIKDVNDQQMAPQRFFLFFVHFRFAEYVMEVFDLFLTSGEAKIVKNFCKTNNFYRFSIKTQ